MAVYTNLKAVENGQHGIFESSRLTSTDIGRLHDVLVRDSASKEIAVDNGVAVKVGAFTGNGLQERYATIAGVGDKVAIIGAPAVVKTAMTKGQNSPVNFTNNAGQTAKAYQVESVTEDIFAIASYQFTNVDVKGDTDFTVVKAGAYVVLDGTGKYTAQASAPSDDTYGFIGKIHSVSAGTYYTVVRILVVKNEQI